MSKKPKPKVTFKTMRIAEDDWQIVAKVQGRGQYIKASRASRGDEGEWSRRIAVDAGARKDHAERKAATDYQRLK